MGKVMLKDLFDKNSNKLSESLQGLTVPKDAEKAQQVISAFFSGLLLEDGEFRQSLTQSEDYILQAVLAILNAQQARYTCLPTSEIYQGKTVPVAKPVKRDKITSRSMLNDATPSIAAGVGALTGGALLGTWGAFCGAIACTAFATYAAKHNLYHQEELNDSNDKSQCTSVKYVEKPLDVSDIISVIGNLCTSIDEIMTTFRAQINNVIQKYENQEKPTFEREHSALLDGIQTLVGYARSHTEDEKFVKKIVERIEDLAESLENYNLTLVDYNGENEGWFEAIPSEKTTEVRQAYPAVAKEGVLIKKGKIFISEK